jgi:hypothetical protein
MAPNIRVGVDAFFLRPLPGFTRLAHQRKSDIRGRLEVTDTIEGIQGYQKNWANPVERTVRDCVTHFAAYSDRNDEEETKTIAGVIVHDDDDDDDCDDKQ